MMERDIFDLSNVADLPSSLKDELCINKRGSWEEKIIEIFKMAKGSLHIDQILVGYYRKHKKEFTRKKMTAKLYNMCRSMNPAIESIEGRKGLYKLAKGSGLDE